MIYNRVRDVPPELRAVRGLAAGLGIAEWVQFVPRSEGFLCSVLEAVRAGLPVMASNADGIAEAVVDEKPGLLVPSA